MTDLSPTTHLTPAFSRRTALTLGGAAASAVVLAACSPGGASETPSAGTPPSEPTAVGSLADLPVGGTASAELGETPILLSRPTEGEVKVFSAICTHQQCVVGPGFECPCHGSVFDAVTGEPTTGPALQPLPQYTVTLDGDTILVSA